MQLWCRLAVIFRRPVREIASWPAWEVRLLDRYLEKQPAAEERIEIGVATMCALFFNANRGIGQSARRLKDFLPFYEPWPMPGRYSEIDREVMEALPR